MKNVISYEWLKHPITCSKHRVERLMRGNGLRALHGYRTQRIPVSKPAVLIPNVLKRQFTVSKPNRV